MAFCGSPDFYTGRHWENGDSLTHIVLFWDNRNGPKGAFPTLIRADFREGDDDSDFSVFRVRRFTEWPEPLHWIAFPVEILTKPLIHWIASPLCTETPFFSLKSASSHPLPQNRLWSEALFSRFWGGFGPCTLRMPPPLKKRRLKTQSLRWPGDLQHWRGPLCRASRWKETFFCANFGWWKTFKICWKVPVKYF